MLATSGCGNSSTEGTAKSSDDKNSTVDAHGDHPHSAQWAESDAGDDGGITQASYTVPSTDPARIAFAKLQPLQVLVGTWRGVTSRSIGGAKALEDPVWDWDFLSDSLSPALVLKSQTSPYLRKARLTYLVDRKLFHLVVADASFGERVYEGDFSQPPKDVAVSNGEMQRSFQLHLAQVTPMPDGDELTISQENNDRYLLVVDRMSESGELQHYDTVQTMRDGDSYTFEPEKHGKHRCVISGGMAAVPVTYGGKTYHVCCPGCKAAFEANPLRWISAPARVPQQP